MTSSQINEIFDKTSFLHGVNTAYIEEMFEKFQTDPDNVPNDWKEFFLGITSSFSAIRIIDRALIYLILLIESYLSLRSKKIG